MALVDNCIKVEVTRRPDARAKRGKPVAF